MTICGKPSKSCERCRGKKIKCDEVKPICSRCQKGGHSCFYRDANDILFRNQTGQTRKRAQEKWRSRATKTLQREGLIKKTASEPAKEPKCEKGSPASSSAVSPITRPSSTSSFGSHEIPSFRPPPTSYPQVDKLIIHRFFCDYVVADTGFTSGGGYLEYLPKLYYQTPPSSCLSLAVSAVSLANMASLVNDQAIKEHGSRVYAEAVGALTNLLHGQNEIEKDETLLAIYLLSFYENIACEKQQESSWKTHIAGAVSILTLRDQHEFISPTAFKIFRLIHSKMLVKSLTNSEMPAIPTSMWTRHYQSAPIALRLMMLLHQTTEIRAIFHQTRSTIVSPPDMGTRAIISNLLSRAQTLDAEFSHWIQSLDLRWTYNAKPWKESGTSERNVPALDVPGGPTIRHEYLHYVIASLWNMYRAARILLHQAIRSCICLLSSSPMISPLAPSYSHIHDPSNPWLPEPSHAVYESQYAVSTAIAIEMIDDISASVDSHFDNHCSSSGAAGMAWMMPLMPPTPGSMSDAELGYEMNWNGRALRGYLLLFPLWAFLEEARQRPKMDMEFMRNHVGAYNLGVGIDRLGGVGGMSATSPIGSDGLEMRAEWVKRVLEYIHVTLGMGQAGEIGEWSLGA